MYNDEQMEEWIMATQYTEEFKRDAVRYWKDHPELGINKCAKNLGISKSALSTWGKAYDENEGSVQPEAVAIMRVMRRRKLPG